MFKNIVIIVSVIIAAFLIFAATRPDTFRVERKLLIKAPPEKIQTEIDNFQRWKAWSPYEKKDPAMKRTYSGAASGVGAIYGWEGDANVGSGSMEVLSSSAQKITIKLDFLKPLEAHNTAEFLLQPQGNSTEVTWAMEGPVPYFAKIIHLFFNMDKMVGGDFAAGLADLKIVVETQP